MRRAGQLYYNSSPGLASLAGAAGRGFARAGQQIVNLGSLWDKQDTRDAAIEAAKKEQEAAQTALRAKNYATNTAMVQKINKQYGISDPLANDVTAPTLANAVLGRVDLGTHTEKKGFTLKEGEAYFDANGQQIVNLPKSPKETKPTQKIGKDGYYYNVDSKGVFHKTDVKAPEYWKGGSGGTKSKAPAGYKFAGEFDISNDLDYELATSGAYFTDKDGKRYINVEKYNRLKKLGDTQIK